MNGFFNGLYPGESAETYVHGKRDGDVHHAPYLIPHSYARYQSVNDVDNNLQVVIIKDGYLIVDDYKLYGFAPTALSGFNLISKSWTREYGRILKLMCKRGEFDGNNEDL